MNLSGRPRDNRFRNCANTGLEKRLGRGSIVRIVHSTRRFTADPRRAHTRAIGIPETRITLIDRLMNRSPRIEFLFSVKTLRNTVYYERDERIFFLNGMVFRVGGPIRNYVSVLLETSRVILLL